jgi:lipopolysaccharide biosynthesis regulator YciM
MKRTLRTILVALALLAGAGCAGGLTGFIVAQRNHQGDLALHNGNVKDAQLAYRLALSVDPTDAHARAGYAQAQLAIAGQEYQKSDFDAAVKTLDVAAKYDPQSVRLAELKSEVESARVKRQIVLTNYPTYSETGLALRKAYAQLHLQSNDIVLALQRFGYTYDSAELEKAIEASAELGADTAKLTARLRSYRQLVESGSPAEAGEKPLAPPASLLPLP